MTKRKILVVEDEESISDPLAAALEREGYATTLASTAADAVEAFRSRSPDLVLLDVMLPDGDGRDVLRQIRSLSRVPVIMLTARGEEMDRIIGLELGADDYVAKPFSAAELVARIRAVLRRTAAPAPSGRSVLEVGGIRVDLDTREVTKDGDTVQLTLKEFELLRMLMEEAGKVVRRTDLMDEIWDPNWYGSMKTLDVHVSSLRKKIGDDPADPRYIKTVRGVGFRFASPEELGEQG
ncbi:MAG TPA: response regulator transcription factor [Actinomycetota bacterium]|jgi:two-component system response regulator RegX3|nr:response regulator transcription factor [Actinomycetota bacterium]